MTQCPSIMLALTVAGVTQHGFAGIAGFCAGGYRNQIGQGIFGKLADLPGPAKRARAVDRGHAQNFRRREFWIAGRQLAHFLEHAEFGVLFPDFANGGQAVGAEADVDAGAGEPLAQKRRMAEIIMAARAMDHVNAMLAEQRGVAARQHN